MFASDPARRKRALSSRRKSSLRSSSSKKAAASAAASPGDTLASPSPHRMRKVRFVAGLITEKFEFSSGRPPSHHLETGRVENREVESAIDPATLTIPMLREDITVLRHYLHLATASNEPDAVTKDGAPKDALPMTPNSRRSARIAVSSKEEASPATPVAVSSATSTHFVRTLPRPAHLAGCSKDELVEMWLDLRSQLHHHEHGEESAAAESGDAASGESSGSSSSTAARSLKRKAPESPESPDPQMLVEARRDARRRRLE
jgi:hypothetical protein